MNYEIRPDYDTDIAVAFRLANTGVTNSYYTLETLTGLVYQAVKISSGAPTAVAGVYIPGAIVQNASSGVVYRNSGSTASPAWTAM